uniref:Peptidase A2 domain-containing protein n=1 Tax=Strongyloides stercoralis TaxID=6248 RepID=A0AAF5DQE9_STRER
MEKDRFSFVCRSLLLISALTQINRGEFLEDNSDFNSVTSSSDSSRDYQEQIDNCITELGSSFVLRHDKTVKKTDHELYMNIDDVNENKDIRQNVKDTDKSKKNTYDKLKDIFVTRYRSNTAVMNAYSITKLAGLVAQTLPNLQEEALLRHQLSKLLIHVKGKTWQRLQDKKYFYQTFDQAFYGLEFAVKNDKESEKFNGECNYCHIRGHKKIDCRKRISDEKKASNFSNDNQNIYRSNVIGKIRNFKLPLVEFCINRSTYTKMIDTGSKIGFIRLSTVIKHGYKIMPCENIIRQALETKAKTLGKVKVPIKLKNKICELKLFCIKNKFIDKAYDIDLDTSAITRFNFVINLAEKEVKIDNESVNLIETVDSNACNVSNLKLKEPIIEKDDAINKKRREKNVSDIDTDMVIKPGKKFRLNKLELESSFGGCFTPYYLVENQNKNENLKDKNFCKKNNIVKYNESYEILNDSNRKLFNNRLRCTKDTKIERKCQSCAKTDVPSITYCELVTIKRGRGRPRKAITNDKKSSIDFHTNKYVDKGLKKKKPGRPLKTILKEERGF